MGRQNKFNQGRWIVALTGASGMRYGLRLVQVASLLCKELHVVFSDAGLRVLAEEEGIKVSRSKLSAQSLFGEARDNIQFHNCRDIGASIASGSKLFDGMVIAPCSAGTLGHLAAGISSNLIHRAADVTLKEGRKLIMVVRETPLSAIHLENMLKLSRMGVCMLPAMPGFYHKPASIADLIDMLVMKILDQMSLPTELVRRWKEPEGRRELQREEQDQVN
ncbi:MAG: aromatic acid decarboxylase [Proteobacteria bacterium]|nr:MAG: aromatic acid decarboxylase [Pseudomonadota bacterium]